ncbi:hypothetical protein SLS62_010968 [Diatrype stigma]|uniref:Ankyrin repeat protein n=1 Tax=Diatrype stigma TaxID=117547 RepID=A0AAN9U8E1_9PEZI
MSNIWVDAGAIPPVLNNYKLAEYLAAHGPVILDQPDPSSGLTPLAISLRRGNVKTVQCLIGNGASLYAKTQDGRTPIYMAATASVQKSRMIQLLLKKFPSNIDDGAPTANDETPLMAAVRLRDSLSVKMLVEAGASKEKKNACGQTAKDIAKELQPPDPQVAWALEATPTTGRGGLSMYQGWVLQVLAYFGIWSPLPDIFDAASRTYHRVAAPGPVPGEDIEEPQTVADFKHNLDNAVKRGGLEQFFPPGDPYVKQVAHKAFELKSDPCNHLKSPAQIDGLCKLALYQPILYCDDSASMWYEEDRKGGGDRWRAQIELVRRISSITTRAVPNNDGCHLRFINKDTSNANHLNEDQIDERIRSYRPDPYNYTPIGTKLREHVLDPFVYKYLDTDRPLTRPYLVLVTTDGYPTGEKAADGNPSGQRDENQNEDADRFRKEIRQCAQKLEEKHYKRNVVRFSISQIGKYTPYEEDAANVKKFLDGLEFDDSIQDVLYRTAEIMDARFEDLKENEKNLEAWLHSITTIRSGGA